MRYLGFPWTLFQEIVVPVCPCTCKYFNKCTSTLPRWSENEPEQKIKTMVLGQATTILIIFLVLKWDCCILATAIRTFVKKYSHSDA